MGIACVSAADIDSNGTNNNSHYLGSNFDGVNTSNNDITVADMNNNIAGGVVLGSGLGGGENPNIILLSLDIKNDNDGSSILESGFCGGQSQTTDITLGDNFSANYNRPGFSTTLSYGLNPFGYNPDFRYDGPPVTLYEPTPENHNLF